MSPFIRSMLGVWLAVSVRRDERGDVPGWVLITVMTAGLVAIIWGIADGALTKLLRDALSNVGAGG